MPGLQQSSYNISGWHPANGRSHVPASKQWSRRAQMSHSSRGWLRLFRWRCRGCWHSSAPQNRPPAAEKHSNGTSRQLTDQLNPQHGANNCTQQRRSPAPAWSRPAGISDQLNPQHGANNCTQQRRSPAPAWSRPAGRQRTAAAGAV